MPNSSLTIFTLENVTKNSDEFIEKTLNEEVFIYPTDTVYGIGGIVTSGIVEKIARFKNRHGKKGYSIIAPSFERIDHNCDISLPAKQLWKEYTAKANGQGITLLLPLKKTSSFPLHLVTETNALCIRIINHPIQTVIEELGQAFISTSCNKTGEPPICSLEDIEKFDGICIDGGVLEGSGSVIFDGVTGERLR